MDDTVTREQLQKALRERHTKRSRISWIRHGSPWQGLEGLAPMWRQRWQGLVWVTCISWI
mgnify:CR=1 FL=1